MTSDTRYRYNITSEQELEELLYEKASLPGSDQVSEEAVQLQKLYLDVVKAGGRDKVYQNITERLEKEGEVIEFCKDFLGDLIKYDKKHNENLCYNLKKYLMNNGNVTKAAKELYIHPNTLAYRIKKIEKILKKDLDDPRERFNLFLALMIKKSTLKD